MAGVTSARGEVSLFGTEGIRGVVGSLYTPNFVADIASAYGTWLGAPGSVLIGQDFRTTSPGISHILAGSLQMLGFDVVEMGPMPTPCFQFNVREFGAKGGLMVTASHNPPEFNGIKFTGPRGLDISPEAQAKIERNFAQRSYLGADWMSAGTIRTDSTGVDRYVTSIRRNIDVPAIQQSHISVVLDPGNGTSAVSSPFLLRAIGCRLITVNSNPDGWFPGRLPEPSGENLIHLAKAVPELGAMVGIAHDGDADRVAFVDEKGQFLHGDLALAVLARYVLKRHPGGTVVTSVTSSSVVKDVVENQGGKIVETKSGSLSLAAGIEKSGAVFGGEENGHYYWPDHLNAPDGPMSSAMMLELLAHEARPLSEIAGEIPVYHLRKDKVTVDRSLHSFVLAHATAALREGADRTDTTDGVKAYFQAGWVLIRPSGTEPIVRVFSEGRSEVRANMLAERGMALVREALAMVPPVTTEVPA
jgi:phosphomannomutase / phosphoglucomutase